MSRHWIFAIKLLLTIAIFAVLLANINLEVITPTLARLNIIVIPVVLIITGIQTLILGLRWQAISKFVGGDLTLGGAVQGTIVSFFFSQGLPASVGGDVFRVWWLGRKTNMNAGAASHSVLLDRLLGFVPLLILCILSIALLAQMGKTSGIIAMEAILGIIIAGTLTLFLPPPLFVKRIWTLLLRKTPPKLTAFLVWLIDLRALMIRISRRPMFSLISLALGIIVHLQTILIAYLVIRALGHDFAFWKCLAAVPPALLLAYLPISIAGWGTREAAMIFGLGLFGLPAADGFLVSMVIGIIILVISLAGGFLWLRSELRGTFHGLSFRQAPVKR